MHSHIKIMKAFAFTKPCDFPVFYKGIYWITTFLSPVAFVIIMEPIGFVLTKRAGDFLLRVCYCEALQLIQEFQGKLYPFT